MRPLATLLLLCALSVAARAQTPGTCELGTAEADLDLADVQARLFNTGSLFYGNLTTDGLGYLVPKAAGNLSPIFASGIWIAGLVDDELRAAGARYDRFEFYPGPLTEGGELPDPTDCSAYDRLWVANAYDLAYYDATGETTGDFADWPAHLGAPVIDGDGVEGNYNLAGGDRPEILGHQTVFWVMNDVGNEHRFTFTEPLGVEVRVTAFVSIEAALQQHTFYRYEVVNKSLSAIEEAYFGLWFDSDLGDASDDYIGSDSTRGLAFTYNAGNTDGNYGTPPPAVGYDFLLGAVASTYWIGGGPPGTTDPADGEELYNNLRGLWPGGEPYTEMGNGYMTDGDTLTWVYPGDPEGEQFWSEVNIDGNGGDNPSGDRRNTLSSGPFVLGPGEAQTFDLAILFATGADHLNSVTVLKAVSGAVQARYDAGTLFAPSPLAFPPPGTLATPQPITPEDGAFLVQEGELSWTSVTGAEVYRVDFATEPDFSDRWVRTTSENRIDAPSRANETATYYWRVQATAGPEQSFFSEPRSFTIYRYVPEYFGEDGERIVETAYPGVEDVCSGAPADPGCAEGVGNTVFNDPNATDDYLVTTRDGDLDRLYDADLFDAEDFEIRFTEACAEAGACLGAYVRRDSVITSVPFELWNLGVDTDPSDDVRMVPLIRINYTEAEPLADWADAFTDEANIVVDGEDVTVEVTERVFWLMPDRPDGYARFEAAANGFGGPGAVYDPENDGDTQVDLRTDGQPCSVPGWYIDFCYRSIFPYRAPIGGSSGMLVADLAGDGTTPPAGTIVRFVSSDPLFVDTEDEASAQPVAFGIEAAYPNPFRSSATVEYVMGAAADVRLAVYDVLGRRVAVLADGVAAAGDHRAQIDGSGWASGVYLVVLEAGGERHARRVLLVR